MSDNTFDEFWLNYLRAHSRRLTRLIHYAGFSTILAGVAAAFWADSWWLALAGLIAGYTIAGSAHYAVQGNRPVLFEGAQASLWSIACALRMYALWLTCRLGPELVRAGIKAA